MVIFALSVNLIPQGQMKGFCLVNSQVNLNDFVYASLSTVMAHEKPLSNVILFHDS